MRYRFVDKIDGIEPWDSISGRKSVSLEEYYLLKPFGREGILPEALILESCVQLVRWLVIRSSGFKQTAVLAELDAFTFKREAGMGEILNVNAFVKQRDEHMLTAECNVSAGKDLIGKGSILLELKDSGAFSSRESMELLWRSLYGQA